MTTFNELGLNPEIMQGLADLEFTKPSPIQAKAIPAILKSKKDLIALAQTGTGKTAAFSLPILNQIKADGRSLQSIILCPTRELCIQLSRDIVKYARHLKGVTVTPVYGGEKIDFQIRSLKSGTNIVVGTPGRVHDLIRRNVLKLQSIKWLVLDEADEMLDMGFKEDLDAILSETPKGRQTLLFSATISRSVRSIAKQYMNDAEEISVAEQNVGAEKVTHEYYVVNARDRYDALKRVLDFLPGVYGILFCRTRRETQEVADKLKKDHYDSEALHGEISQGMRTKIMDRFKHKQIRLLVATDVAARGIDVNDLSHVINYNLPDQNEAYTHRSGRTGRAQKSGVSISILTQKDVRRVKELEMNIGKSFEHKQVPDGKEVCLKQIDSFLQEIEETNIDKIGDEQFLLETVERLKKIKKEDLIKHVIAHKFSNLMGSYRNSRDLNVEAKAYGGNRIGGGSGRGGKFGGSEEGTNLKINLGKRSGFEVKSLFFLINSNKSLKGVEIGKINLMPEHTIFSVEKKRADEVVKCLNGSNFKGKRLLVSRSGSGVGYSSEKRKSGPRVGYQGKKVGYKGRR